MYLTLDIVVLLVLILAFFIAGVVTGLLCKPKVQPVGTMIFDTANHLIMVSWDNENYEELAGSEAIIFRVISAPHNA